MPSKPPEDRFVDAGVPPAAQRFCNRCGFFRVHGHPCISCAMNGVYAKRDVESETMKIVVEMIRDRAPGHELREYLEKHLLVVHVKRASAAKDHRSFWQLPTGARRILSAKQLRLLVLLLNEVIKLFEVDERGILQIYDDRMDEARATIGLAKRFVPELMRHFRMPGAPKAVSRQYNLTKARLRDGRKPGRKARKPAF